jgi:hypothetical protein
VCRRPSINIRQKEHVREVLFQEWVDYQVRKQRPISTLQDYTNRKINDLLWEDDLNTSKVVAWWTFCTIWKEDCPKIRIRPPINETCGEYTISQNAFRYKQQQHKHSNASDSNSDEEVDNEEDLEIADINPQEMETTEDSISNLAKTSSLECSMR